ncbi:MAG: hypothetical protein LBQ79_02065, partial [Deltaproteobacteria bacterium]|nr:hypothetical protein [Deltaproteobacteria bacterium]
HDPITISIGIAALTQQTAVKASSTDSLLKLLTSRADEALYMSKTLGGNKVCAYGVDISAPSEEELAEEAREAAVLWASRQKDTAAGPPSAPAPSADEILRRESDRASELAMRADLAVAQAGLGAAALDQLHFPSPPSEPESSGVSVLGAHAPELDTAPFPEVALPAVSAGPFLPGPELPPLEGVLGPPSPPGDGRVPASAPAAVSGTVVLPLSGEGGTLEGSGAISLPGAASGPQDPAGEQDQAGPHLRA